MSNPTELRRYNIGTNGLSFYDPEGVWVAYEDVVARRAQPEAEAPQAVAVAYLHQVVCGDGEPDEALSFEPDNFPLAGTLGYRSLSYQPLYTRPAAPLSPLCGAQHAESGKQSGSIGDLAEFHILLNWYDNEASYGSINDGRNKLTEYIDKWAARRADPQAATPGVQSAQEQASTTRVTETKRAQLEARGYEVVGYVMQNSVNELCTLAHGRVEWLGKGSAPGTPEAPKRLTEEEVRELALQHLHDDTESAGRNGFFTFSAEGLDGFAIDLMDSQRASQLDGGQEGSDHA